MTLLPTSDADLQQPPTQTAWRTAEVEFAGQDFIASNTGTLFWPGERMLIVADLHLEKASSFARKGQFLPPYDTATTLAALTRAIDEFNPRHVVALGDSFHDHTAHKRLVDSDRTILSNLRQSREWTWLVGNHDPLLSDDLGGTVAPALDIKGIRLRHDPVPDPPSPQIAGHLHPCAKFETRATILRRPCFALASDTLILPAFGSLTGGLNVLDAAFTSLHCDAGFSIYITDKSGIFPVASKRLRRDGATRANRR